jgi:D-alanine-D-alanine ligase
MSKRIVVLMGGWSEEREVSLSSAQGVMKALKELGYQVFSIDVTRDIAQLVQQLIKYQPDVVFNILHGTGGEDGVIQGILEAMHVPYTFSGVAASAIGMNKVLARKIFEREGLLSPEWKVVSVADLEQGHPMPMPYVIKPISDGSSKGVHIIHKSEDLPDFTMTWKPGTQLLIEKYIHGREIQVAVMGDRALGAIEICPKQGFYDYEAKYTEGKAVHLMPAPVSPESYQRVLDDALKAHQAIECRGITRSDFRYDDQEDKFYLLEINTQPGMTPLSLVPEIAAHQGISFHDLIEWMVDHAQCDQPHEATSAHWKMTVDRQKKDLIEQIPITADALTLENMMAKRALVL